MGHAESMAHARKKRGPLMDAALSVRSFSGNLLRAPARDAEGNEAKAEQGEHAGLSWPESSPHRGSS